MIKQLLLRFMSAGLSTVSKAPAKPQTGLVQADLFPEPKPVSLEPLFPIGGIVLQSWPWIGSYQTTYLYFQVRGFQTEANRARTAIINNHKSWTEDKVEREYQRQEEARQIEIAKLEKKDPEAASHWKQPEEISYLCESIPYGFRMQECNWFDESYLIDTGLRWKVPSNEDLDQWCIRAHPYPKDSTSSEGMSQLGGYTRWFLNTYHTPLNATDLERPVKIEQYHYDNKPFPEERGLVRLLNSLDPDWPRWDRLILRGDYNPVIDELLRKKGLMA